MIPTFYYDTNNGQPGGSTEFILNQFPWAVNVTDGALFYFQNRKGGQDMCRNSPLCGTNPSKSYWVSASVVCLFETSHTARVKRAQSSSSFVVLLARPPALRAPRSCDYFFVDTIHPIYFHGVAIMNKRLACGIPAPRRRCQTACQARWQTLQPRCLPSTSCTLVSITAGKTLLSYKLSWFAKFHTLI